MSKQFLLIVGFLLVSKFTYSQTTAIPEIDSLKMQLNSLQSSVDSIKKQTEIPAKNKADATAKILKTKADITTQQIEAIRICAKFNDRFAQGSAAINTILSGIQSGVSIGELSSPFVNPAFKKSYDNWLSKWGKFIPAVVLPALSIALKDNNAKIGSVSIGISLTAILSAISSSDKQRNTDITKAITGVTNTMDLFEFNRSVYDDIQKLKSVITSVNASDSTFNNEFQEYWKANQDILTLSDDAITKDQRFKTFIDNTTVYFDRFQLKLARVNYVLDYAQGMINSYKLRYRYVSSTDTTQSQMLKDTRKAIIDLEGVYSKFKNDWTNLQTNFYKITPTETRKLQLFYQLEEIKKNLYQ